MGVGNSKKPKEEENEKFLGEKFIEEEDKIKGCELMPIDSIVPATKSLCKIITSYKIASGFLIKLFKGEEDFYCLISNEHIITKNMIKNKEKITFLYDSESKRKEIYLNNEERYIKDFRDINIDATVVEILKEDKIDKEYYLLPYIDYIYDKNKLKEKEITIIQYPNGKLCYSNGKIKDINNNEIIHLASTEEGSSGSPIFIKDSIKVIGIHKGGKKDKTENYGDFIGPIYNFFINLLKFKIELENGEYYIGELFNNLKHGKGIIYYKNGNIKYEGDFINDKREGNGK